MYENLSKVQDLFLRMDEPSKKAVYNLMEILACRTEVPTKLSVFDSSGLDLIKSSGFTETALDNFKTKEEVQLVKKPILTKEEISDIEEFNKDINLPDLKPVKKKEVSKKPTFNERNKIKNLLEKTPLWNIWTKKYDSEKVWNLAKEIFDDVAETYDPRSKIWKKEVYPRMKELGYSNLKPKAQLAILLADKKGYL